MLADNHVSLEVPLNLGTAPLGTIPIILAGNGATHVLVVGSSTFSDVKSRLRWISENRRDKENWLLQRS